MQNKSLSIINPLCLCLFSITFIYDYCKHINIPLVVGSFAIWFITSQIIEPNWTTRASKMIRYIVPLYIVDLIYCIAVEDSIAQTFITSTLAYLWILIFFFYIRNVNLLKWSILFFIAVLCVDCFDTVAGNLAVPGASRMQGDGYDRLEAALLMQSMHIGGYPLLYALTFLTLPVALWIKYKLPMRILSIVFLVISIATIFVGSYFLSILFSLLLISSSFVNAKKSKRLFFIILSMLTIFVVFKDPILNGVIYIGENIESPILIGHATELKEGEKTTTTTTGRGDLYMGAVQNFLDSPLIGQIGDVKLAHESGHSELLEYLEKYGLFAIPFFLFWYNLIKSVRREIQSESIRVYYYLYSVCLFVFMLINPIRWGQPLVFVLFFGAPLLFIVIDQKSLASHKNHKQSQYIDML